METKTVCFRQKKKISGSEKSKHQIIKGFLDSESCYATIVECQNK